MRIFDVVFAGGATACVAAGCLAEPPGPMRTFDIVFAGGGTTACVTAGRLAAADPTLRILVLEAGPHTKDLPQYIQPARFWKNLTPNSSVLTFNEGRPSKALLGRAPVVSCARAVGGGSSINFMVYNRAAASDYDAWETIYGNRGWGSDKLIPLLKKAETYQGKITNDKHGTSGPIKVSFSQEYNNVGVHFLEVAAAYDKGRPLTDDINAFTSSNQYGRWARYIDIKTGTRSDTAHHYIYNQSHNANLTVLDKSRVIRVIFENGRAIGVEYISEVNGTSSYPPSRIVVKASRLVVVAAGAFGSPAILERSGIGSKAVLDKNDIRHVVDLPGVGEHYMDHIGAFIHYHGSEETESLDGVLRGDEADEHEAQWLKDGTGLLSQTGFDGLGKIRPTEEERKTMSPEFNHRWETFFADYPDKSVVAMCTSSSAVGALTQTGPGVPIGKYFAIGPIITYPLATGRVHITAGLDPHGKLDFHPGYMDELADVATFRWAYKKFREHARRMKFYRGEVLSSHPKFPNGSAAETRSSAMPVEITAPDIVYTKEDDEAIDQHNREIAGGTWHSCGTCAMKPRDQGGVVDERLNVYGVKNLKVADLSIIPENVGSNTYNTAIGIGEKAAVIIAEDLGIKGVTEC